MSSVRSVRPVAVPFLALALLALAAVLCATPAAAQGDSNQLTFDLVFDHGKAGAAPFGLNWSPAGDRLAYLYDDGSGTALWVLSPGNGEPRAVLRELPEADGEDEADDGMAADGEETKTEEAPKGPPGLGFGVGFAWSPDGRSLLLTAGGDLWLLPAEGGEPRRLTDSEKDDSDAAFSPDGSKIAFIRDYDLHLLDVASGEVTALTSDGSENEILNGVTDWVYWEEIWSRDATGFWWSPDGSKIAYYRFDEAPVESYPLVDFTKVPYPEVTWQKYPKSGTANPEVKIGVLDLGSGETTWLDTGNQVGGADPDAYLARVHWRPDGQVVAVHRLAREQDRIDLLACRPSDGTCSRLLSDTWPTWVNLQDDFAWLSDGRFVWGSEKSGWRHLYLHAADGSEIRALTAGDWAVTSLDGVDETRGQVIYGSFPPGPLGAKDRRISAVPLAAPANGGVPESVELTTGEGWHGATVSTDSGLWVHTWNDANTPPSVEILDADGAQVATLPTRAPAFDPAALPQWRFFTLDGPDGAELPARMLMPPGVERAGGMGDGAMADEEMGHDKTLHGAIMYHYGGPASQVVVNRWDSRGGGLWQKMMAQRGYAILSADNVASVFFGKRGEDRQYRQFGPLNLAAQKTAAAYLADLPWVDGSRIGLWGWSGGGFNTLYCLFHSPGTWAAGMAGAPVTDWRLYDTIWTERYLDKPQDNPEGYEKSSPIHEADQLADRLLVVHGTGDDNVHPQNTIALAAKLVAAGKPFEDALYPRQKHGFFGPSWRHFFERMTRFFDDALAAPPDGAMH